MKLRDAEKYIEVQTRARREARYTTAVRQEAFYANAYKKAKRERAAAYKALKIGDEIQP